MEEIINEIIAIEGKAQRIVSDAKKAETGLDERIENDTKKMRGDIEKGTDEKTAQINLDFKNDTDAKIKAINTAAENKMAELEKKYQINRDKWVHEIMNGIIG